jgi:protein TonB
MKRTVSLFEFMPYGAPELLASGRPHLARALLLSTIFAALLFLAAWPLLSRLRVEIRPIQPPADPFDIARRPDILPPPLREPRASVADASGRRDAIPVPVPDDIHGDLVEPILPGLPADVPNGVIQDPIRIAGTSEPAVETLPERGETRPMDDLPAEITVFRPEYPSIARDAGVEGLVVVHALIGKDGRVIRAEVDSKHSIPLLDETARAAALRWVFTPAYYQGRPVAVWYAIPFRFVLNDPGR